MYKLVNKRVTTYGLSREDKKDLLQEANIAVFKASYTFDATQNTKFGTYAWYQIEFALDAWMIMNYNIRIPATRFYQIIHYYQLKEEYAEHNNGAMAPETYFIEKMMITEKILHNIVEATEKLACDSLDREYNENGDSIMALVADEDNQYTSIFKNDEARRMRSLIKNLRNEREKKVMIDHYYKDRTFREIAKEMNVTEQRVGQIHRSALEHLYAMPDMLEIAGDNDIEIKIEYRRTS